jgi:signal transduction histidine kinase
LRAAELTDRERVEYVGIALRHSERLTRLVAELFELAKLEANETRPQRETFSAAELVQDVAQKFSLSARERGVDIRVSAPRDLPFAVGDIGLTERVLDNLIENALRCTPGGGRIRLSLERDGSMLAVRVADTGRGIPEPDLPLVFRPFSRGAPGGEAGDHAGLGLAIAQRIVELQGGHIRASSRVGQGSVFSFTLPLAEG